MLVRFVEWGKQQETPRFKIVRLTEMADDEGARESEGDCELCGRCMKLTFHHLVWLRCSSTPAPTRMLQAHCLARMYFAQVPKETHNRYLGKHLPAGVAEAARAMDLDPQPSRDFLHQYGAMLCRFCHSTVHRFAPNAVLAERFNTIDKLLEQPTISGFIAFASRQRAGRRF